VTEANAPKRAGTVSSWDLVFPNDANPYGSMFGGRLMALMDKVGALAGSDYAGRIVTTASVEAMDFKSPIYVGDRIEILARVVRVGRTSMVVKVDAYSDNPLTRERRHCTTAHFNFVALDAAGKPTPVPPLAIEAEQSRKDWEVAGIIQNKARMRRDKIAAHAHGGPADDDEPEG
jgi:acyl-CoA thioesterase YciA